MASGRVISLFLAKINFLSEAHLHNPSLIISRLLSAAENISRQDSLPMPAGIPGLFIQNYISIDVYIIVQN